MPSKPTAEPTLYRARWIAPIAQPVITDGGVVVRDGLIEGVGPFEELRTRFGHVTVEDLGQTVLLPGLVNAHVHLELSDLTPGESPTSFVDWLLGIMSRGPGPDSEDRITRATQNGVRQCLRFGVTTVGDITRYPQITRPVLVDSPLRAISFGEVTAMSGRRHYLEPRVAAAMMKSAAPERIVAAISPHAPYSIETTGYERCVKAAITAGVPLATHLHETPDEISFLVDHNGPFRRLWDALGGLDGEVPKLLPREALPMAFLHHTGMLKTPWLLLAHMNYSSAADVRALANSNATIVYCPRTHAYFGHPPHDWRRMLDNGVNVAVGTDSTGSSPDLNLVDDLRVLRHLAPDLDPCILWEMATRRGASALGFEDRIGTLEVGKAADLIAFPANADRDPLGDILDSDAKPSAVFIAGRRISD